MIVHMMRVKVLLHGLVNGELQIARCRLEMMMSMMLVAMVTMVTTMVMVKVMIQEAVLAVGQVRQVVVVVASSATRRRYGTVGDGVGAGGAVE